MKDLYLDANATTPVLPAAAKAALETMEDLFGNPSSSHVAGLRARSVLTKARVAALDVLGAKSGRIVFTSGATEAIQTAILSAMCDIRTRETSEGAAKRYCLFGATEHKAVPQALRHWCEILEMPHEIVEIPVDEKGLLDLNFISEYAAQTDLVCTMAVNNETGVFQDLSLVEKAFRPLNAKALWMVDAVQAVGKRDLNVSGLSIDYAPASGHKLYAPKGIGLLYVREGAPFKPLIAGGGQESGARGGTENLPGVAAIHAVLEAMKEGVFNEHDVMVSYRDRLIESLKSAFPKIVFNTPFEHAVPTTINFAVAGLSSKEILDLFDAADVRVSSGSACGSALVGSYVLEAMGLAKWRSDGAIRLSFGPLITEAEVKLACQRISATGVALRNSCLIVREEEAPPTSPVTGLIQLKRDSMCTWIYLDAATKSAVIIDPFLELADRIEVIIRCQGSRILAILDTHMHVDHESPRVELIERYSDLLAPGARTEDPLGWPVPTGSVQVGSGESAPTMALGDDQVIARVELPGHTVVGCAYLVGTPQGDSLSPAQVELAFTGDTVLMGGIGRTDFGSSSMEALYHSLKGLPALLGPATVICPTHDYHNGFATTLESERRGNCFLRRLLDEKNPMTLAEFSQEKPLLDDGIDDESSSELVCGNIAAASGYQTSLNIAPEDRKEFFKSHQGAVIVDVREPHEFGFAQDWLDLGLCEAPLNVPLTRFAGYVHTLLSQYDDPSTVEVICLCRSGTRSERAAEVLQRCGFKNSWNLVGGLALSESVFQDAMALGMEMEYAI